MSGDPSNVETVPRRLWFLWLQGVDNAPTIVRRCLETWTAHNPSWDIVALAAG
jgi:mannosyltransferase OCH1-like enzyme